MPSRLELLRALDQAAQAMNKNYCPATIAARDAALAAYREVVPAPDEPPLREPPAHVRHYVSNRRGQ